MKAQFVQGNHDLLSTLTSVSGHHRISCTRIHPAHLIRRREEPLAETLATVAGHREVGGVWLVPMPMAALIGADYGRLARDVSARTGKRVLSLPCKSLSGDWLAGYDESLLALARDLDPAGRQPRPDRVAIVGHLFDRNEADQLANVAELTRLLEALGLTVTSVWLSGQAWADLGAVRDAATIIALPYARRAAGHIAHVTGAQLVDAGLPLGLDGTASWLRKVADATGRQGQAEHTIRSEFEVIIPRLEWLVPHVLHGKRVGFIGDPHFALAFVMLLREVGATPAFVVATSRRAMARGLDAALGDEVPVLVWPTQRALASFVAREASATAVDLVVTNAFGWPATRGLPALELGFPSFFRHALFERPFLGFRGALALLDDLATTLRTAEATAGRDAPALGPLLQDWIAGS